MDESKRPLPDNLVQRASHLLTEANLETYEKQKKRIDLKYQLNDLLDAQKRIESEIRRKVQSAVDPDTGKPLYTNDKMRDAAFVEECGKDSDWIEAKGQIFLTQKEMDYLDVELDLLRHQRRHIDLDYQYLIASTAPAAAAA